MIFAILTLRSFNTWLATENDGFLQFGAPFVVLRSYVDRVLISQSMRRETRS
jgi:hypothetical protein